MGKKRPIVKRVRAEDFENLVGGLEHSRMTLMENLIGLVNTNDAEAVSMVMKDPAVKRLLLKKEISWLEDFIAGLNPEDSRIN